MPELSLTQLAEERQGVWISSLTCRTIRPCTDDAALERLGFADLRSPGGVVYGLPKHIAENETLLNVWLRRHVDDNGEGVDQWVLTWEQLTEKLSQNVPVPVAAESDRFGGSVGLEERVRQHWDSQSDMRGKVSPDVLVHVEYLLKWRPQLLSSKPRKINKLTVVPAGSLWSVEEADILRAISLHEIGETNLRVPDERTMLTAIARPKDGPLDAANFERRIWKDVSQLLEESA